MLDILRLTKFSELSGYSQDAIHAKKQDGTWAEGVIWFKAPDSTIHINMEEYYKWVTKNYTKALKQSARHQSKSPSRIRVKGVASVSGASPPPLT